MLQVRLLDPAARGIAKRKPQAGQDMGKIARQEGKLQAPHRQEQQRAVHAHLHDVEEPHQLHNAEQPEEAQESKEPPRPQRPCHSKPVLRLDGGSCCRILDQDQDVRDEQDNIEHKPRAKVSSRDVQMADVQFAIHIHGGVESSPDIQHPIAGDNVLEGGLGGLLRCLQGKRFQRHRDEVVQEDENCEQVPGQSRLRGRPDHTIRMLHHDRLALMEELPLGNDMQGVGAVGAACGLAATDLRGGRGQPFLRHLLQLRFAHVPT
mmetsp:Transcript_30672/g.70842  ORF Transcript_30672/g.70842 Transcript_30672/m.70842 type:complete len:263 (-) Transcript_30672:588-1376(-)